MILASGLSFLGLGVRPPEPEWGLMLNTLRTAIYSQPLRARAAGRDDLHHLDLRSTCCRDGLRVRNGREGMMPDACSIPRDRGGPAQPLLSCAAW